MGKCATCGHRIGLFGRKWRKLDRAKHCLWCVPRVMAERKERVFRQILAGGEPRMILGLPAYCRDPDYPANYRRYTGMLVMADKGVIFAQFGEFRKEQTGAFWFGIVGAIADAAKERDSRRQAMMAMGPADISEGVGLLDRAEQLFFYPASEIRKLKVDNTRFRVKAGGKPVLFAWAEGRHTAKPYRHLLDAYVRAAKAGRDVVAECADTAVTSR